MKDGEQRFKDSTWKDRAKLPQAVMAGLHGAVDRYDPPRAILGFPRVVSTAEDIRWNMEAVDSPQMA